MQGGVRECTQGVCEGGCAELRGGCAGAARCGGAARRASPSCCSTKPVAVRFMATWFGFGFGSGLGAGAGLG